MLRETSCTTRIIYLPPTEEGEGATLTTICEGSARPSAARISTGTGDARTTIEIGTELLERIGTLLEDRRRDLPGEYQRRCCPEHGILAWPDGAYRCPMCAEAEAASKLVSA